MTALDQPLTGEHQHDQIRIELRTGAGWPGWNDVLRLRRQVFGDEQGIAGATVIDPDDERGVHALAILEPDSGRDAPARLVGIGRITLHHRRANEALIAWVAIDAAYRQRGAGTALMQTLLDEADRAGIEETVLAAQTHAEAFYRNLGFSATGSPYAIRGIPHRWMKRIRGW